MAFTHGIARSVEELGQDVRLVARRTRRNHMVPAAIIGVLALALSAALQPALRAAAVNPGVVVREE